MSIGGLRNDVREIKDKIVAGRATLAEVTAHVDEARSIAQGAMQGASAPEAGQVIEQHTAALDIVAMVSNHLDRVVQILEDYVKRLGPGAAAAEATRRAPPEPAAAPSSPGTDFGPVPAEKIKQLREELPPPVTSGVGSKTHGRLVVGDKVRNLVSGKDSMSDKVISILASMGSPGKPQRASDVEMKTAAWQRTTGTKHATVVINHVPCKGRMGCDTLVPVILPTGYSLTVHGQYTDGRTFYKKYTGGAEPWWR
ncbi:hypothetical protein ALI144C_12230 [Actinosynnema sp. ALI-1.44]|uniref:DddA-like double-stranded DNA deaminase toxin n=1 Tax=Actinosynnema sp. ALI-1.44 TaxID=1933779 RepID=UPI00097BC028|nr:DddA-like double-stranded DNA deaminase toxin [Actinosynnema sp. ALI-1.44]ONI85874.1 hypothetical protein ALI144C_12230 [Actinosynnema sp. ALI-1.44]